MSTLLSTIQAPLSIDRGGKANHLARLQRLGYRVPPWVVLGPPSASEPLDTASLLRELATFFGPAHAAKTYAVRSSAGQEDGRQHSFAGQFATFLHVSFNRLAERIEAVRASVHGTGVRAYRAANELETDTTMHVIVQEMIDADVAGVAFGIDPVSGDPDTTVISALYGLGEGLVSGELDADTYTVRRGEIQQRIVAKEWAIARSYRNDGTERVPVEVANQKLPSLSVGQVRELTEVTDRLRTQFGGPQDVEFAYYRGELYLLQTRPVTTTATPPRGEYTLYDNSNIVESYPGITTPLTFTFILKMYDHVYRQLVGLFGVSDRQIERHAEVFAHTLGLVRGRVYYNLLNWYKALALMPGYALNAERMEQMMGVKERFELDDSFRTDKGAARWRLAWIVGRTVCLQARLGRDRRRFQAHLDRVMAEYQALDLRTLSIPELVRHYQDFEQRLLLEWKAPLVNDFFAMIWFGRLRRYCRRYRPDLPNLHNDLLCGSQDIISVEPIRQTVALTRAIAADAGARALFASGTGRAVWQSLQAGACPLIYARIREYLERFGERCVGELKLETISYAQAPHRFVELLQTYLEQGVHEQPLRTGRADEIRRAAEAALLEALRGKPLQRRWMRFVLRRTRDVVSNRENLRYERTRGFGMVRRLFTALGERLHAAGHLADPADVFYLELPEIEALATQPVPALQALVAERRATFEEYRQQPPPRERFFTYGTDFSDQYVYSDEKMEGAEADLQGIGCCPGIVTGRVRVITDPRSTASLDGDILVTTSTDPGWVTLFPTAAAIVVARGSLLSHSAIVAREMGIPCIVGVTGLLRTLRTGDRIRLDGATGHITLLDSENMPADDCSDLV